MQGQPSRNSRRARLLAAASFVLIALAIGNWPTQARAQSAYPTTDIRAVPTYEAVGLYWANPGANARTGCELKFPKSADNSCTQRLALCFDTRNSECHASLLHP